MSVVVIMPAYNAAKTLKITYENIPQHCVDKIILTDDVSQDETVDISQELGLKTIVHVQNRGYGGNQKTSYLEALKEGAEIVVMLHPDNQYDATRIPALIEPIRQGKSGLYQSPQFTRTLPEVMSRYHWAEIEQDTSVSSKTQNA